MMRLTCKGAGARHWCLLRPSLLYPTGFVVLHIGADTVKRSGPVPPGDNEWPMQAAELDVLPSVSAEMLSPAINATKGAGSTR